MPRPAPDLAIVGATATGKTALAVALAQRLDAEILSADSRQLYRGMDIGTAKPTPTEQAAARHWLIDIAAPDETVTLAAFLDLAESALRDMHARRKRAIVAGGTGQYVWSVIEGWRVPRVPPDPELRRTLEQLARAEGPGPLVEELRRSDPDSLARIDPRNVRRLIRALEVTRTTGRPFSAWQQREPAERAPTIIGLRLERAELHRRIDRRVERMIADGLIDEVRRLNASGYGCELPAMSGIGYRQVCEYLAGVVSLEDAVSRIKTETHRLARIQHTWFKPRDTRIVWLEADAPDLIERAARVVAAQLLP